MVHNQLAFISLFCLSLMFDIHDSIAQQNGSTVINASDFDWKLDELLSLDMAAKISGFDPSEAEKEYGNNAHKAFGGEKKPPRECNYRWDKGRKRETKIGDKTMISIQKDIIGINWVSNTTLERFKRNYPTLTEEQKKEAEAKLLEESRKNQQRNEASEAMDKTAVEMFHSNQSEQIFGVGEAAVWYPKSSELKVYYNGLTFALVVNISDTEALNKQKAIELALLIIEKKLP